MPDIRILTEGDSSVLVEFGKEISPEINRKITATVQLMKEQHIEGVVDMIPAFCSLLENPQILGDMVRRSGAHSTDMQQPESPEDVFRRCRPYATSWMPTADRLWAEKHPGYVDPENPESANSCASCASCPCSLKPMVSQIGRPCSSCPQMPLNTGCL